jgi:hypothetical protein
MIPTFIYRKRKCLKCGFVVRRRLGSNGWSLPCVRCRGEHRTLGEGRGRPPSGRTIAITIRIDPALQVKIQREAEATKSTTAETIVHVLKVRYS